MIPVEPPHERGATSASVLPRAVSLPSIASTVRHISNYRLEVQDMPMQQSANPCPASGESPKHGAAIVGEFLAGPIDFRWLERAAELPGAAFHIAILIRHLLKLRHLEWVPISNGDAARFGIKPDAKRRAILALEDAGLVEVRRQAGRSPRTRPAW